MLLVKKACRLISNLIQISKVIDDFPSLTPMSTLLTRRTIFEKLGSRPVLKGLTCEKLYVLCSMTFAYTLQEAFTKIFDKTLHKICENMSFHFPAFSRMTIRSLCRRIWVNCNPNSHIFYGVKTY